jgi:homoserine kinase
MILTARVPATVANLGPGFDAMAMAVTLHNEVRLETGVEPAVEVRGEGEGELPEDASNLIFKTMSFVTHEVGGSLPPFRLECVNAIPLERGLGSSAAAVVAGVLLADRLIDAKLDPDRLLELAVDLEGHADNVSACLRGGLVIAYLSGDGWRAERMDPHPSLRPVVLVPRDERVPTKDARRALPREVPLADASFNVSRAALAVLAFTTRPELLHHALEDRLHQGRRLPLAPASRAMFEDLRSRGVPVCVAGAGPSLLAFESDERSVPDLGPGWDTLRLQPAAAGADVVREGR